MKKIIILVFAVLILTFAAQSRSVKNSGVISGEGLKTLIMNYEGLRLSAYRCPAGVLTIGYGSTRGVKPGMMTTRQDAILLLRKDCSRFENFVNKTVDRELKIHEFDALVSFCYNLGYVIKGELLDYINAGATKLVTFKIRLYNKARVGGKLTVLRGLQRRRNTEANWYAKGKIS